MWNHFLVQYLFFPALFILPWSLFLEMLACRAEPPPRPFKDWGGGTLVPLPEERDCDVQWARLKYDESGVETCIDLAVAVFCSPASSPVAVFSPTTSAQPVAINIRTRAKTLMSHRLPENVGLPLVGKVETDLSVVPLKGVEVRSG